MEKTITNDEFLEAKDNLDNKRLIFSILQKYKNIFSYEELENIGNIALWKCLLKHNPNLGQKFTTSLYNHVMWQVLVELRNYNKDKKYTTNTVSSGVNTSSYEQNNNLTDVKDILNTLEPRYRDIVYEYYIEQRTLADISERHDIGIKTASKRIKEGISLLRDKCN